MRRLNAVQPSMKSRSRSVMVNGGGAWCIMTDVCMKFH